ncbi:hypothetical protein ACFGVR_09320 [Mucilaginibacter sp. AW1-3]
MKNIILISIVFLNLLPCIQKGSLHGDPSPTCPGCSEFNSWIINHTKVSSHNITYYASDNSRHSDGVNCDCGGMSCSTEGKYWCTDGADWFYYSSSGWIKIDKCSACRSIIFNYDKAVPSTGSIPYPGDPNIGKHAGWCIPIELAVITGLDPCDIAKYYYRSTNGTNCTAVPDIGTDPDDIPALFQHYHVTAIKKTTPLTLCDIINYFSPNDGRSLLIHIPDHDYLILGVERTSSGTVTFDVFDPDQVVGNSWLNLTVDFSSLTFGDRYWTLKK